MVYLKALISFIFKVSSYQVIFLADKFATDITRFHLTFIKPRCSESTILNVDGSKDMSILIRSTNKH